MAIGTKTLHVILMVSACSIWSYLEAKASLQLAERFCILQINLVQPEALMCKQEMLYT